MTRVLGAVPVLPVAEIKPAARFYVRRLGFESVYVDTGYGIVARDGVELHLWAATDKGWRARLSRPGGAPIESGAESFLAGTASCRLRVEGIAALHARAEADGIVHPNGPLADKPWGLREFAVLDPDGNLVTFFEPVPR